MFLELYSFIYEIVRFRVNVYAWSTSYRPADLRKSGAYRKHTRELLDSIVQTLPEFVRLLRYRDIAERRVNREDFRVS